jgi:hypothetical protein
MSKHVVKVRDVAAEMDVMSDEITVYMNRRTGEFVAVSDEESAIVEGDVSQDELPDWQAEILPKLKEALESDDFLPLPGKFDIHEWDIMRRFCGTVEDAEQSQSLLDALHGRGAFRYFRDQVQRLELEDAWFRYRDRAFEDIARNWLEEHGIRHDREDGEDDL